jgi:tRNA pseudouridine55 synthase
MDGILVVDKPVGPTSHEVVACVRRAIGEPRVGHTGTLDPGASGVLPLVIGRATRLSRFLSAAGKEYEARLRLGAATDTGDAQGRMLGAPYDGPLPTAADIESALTAFRGTFRQQPPIVSAKKIEGERSYRLARRGTPAPRPAPVDVTVQHLALIGVDGDSVQLRIECSAGFYVRSLAHDLGEQLGTGAHVSELRRTRSGDFTLATALGFERILEDPASVPAALIPPAAALPRLSTVQLTDEGARRAAHGRILGPDDLAAAPPGRVSEWVRLLDVDGQLVGLARPVSGVLHPSIVLV